MQRSRVARTDSATRGLEPARGRPARVPDAERIGLSRGDVVLTVGGAPLYKPGELGVIERIARRGQELTATWGHEGDWVEGTATV